MGLAIWREWRLSMRLNCPHCNKKFRFLDLFLFRLKGYNIKCIHCNNEFKLPGRIDQFGILLFALIAIGLVLFFGAIFKFISNHFSFSSIVDMVIIAFIILIVSIIIIYGHPYYLVWHIRKKYLKNVWKNNGKE